MNGEKKDSTMSIQEFCDKHDACKPGRLWALSTGAKNLSELWARDDLLPEWRIWIATRKGVLDDKTLRLFACWCVRQVWHLLADARSRKAVEVAERFAEGKATHEELAAARAAASVAARAAASAAASAAARAAASAAAWAAASVAASAAAMAAAMAAALAAARDKQAAWLIQNAPPDFTEEGSGR
jgi:hypothetical protein